MPAGLMSRSIGPAGFLRAVSGRLPILLCALGLHGPMDMGRIAVFGPAKGDPNYLG